MSILTLGPGVKVSGPWQEGPRDLQGLRPHTSMLGADKGGEAVPKSPEMCPTGPPTAHLGHLDPVLHHPRPVLGHHPQIPKAGCDDEAGHPSEVLDSGLDGGYQVLIAGLVPLAPGGAQALTGHNLPEELLENRGSVT